MLSDTPTLLARLCGNDKIGTAPDNIIPCYCESCFPGESIADFMNLPCEPPDREALLPHIHWLPLETLLLEPNH